MNDKKIVTRQEAIDAGLPRYFTGEPCKNGHVAARLTLSSACLECKAEYVKRDRQRMADARAALEESGGR
jgi:hypothetical protein